MAAARQTPPGAEPNRNGAGRKPWDLCPDLAVRVGCLRRRATGVPDEWPSRGSDPALQNPAYRPTDANMGARQASACWALALSGRVCALCGAHHRNEALHLGLEAAALLGERLRRAEH